MYYREVPLTYIYSYLHMKHNITQCKQYIPSRNNVINIMSNTSKQLSLKMLNVHQLQLSTSLQQLSVVYTKIKAFTTLEISNKRSHKDDDMSQFSFVILNAQPSVCHVLNKFKKVLCSQLSV